MSTNEQAVLNDYLLKVEKRIGYLSVEDRLEILSGVKNFLTQHQIEKELDMKVILRQFQDIDSLINIELAKRSMAPLKKKSGKGWKIFLISIFSFFLIAVLAIVFTIKSFLPLVNVNDIDGTLELFGSRLVLEKADSDYFTKINDREFIQWRKGAKLAKGTFDFGGNSKDYKFNIKLRNGELAVRTHEQASLSYTCYTQEQLQKIFTKAGETFIMNIDAKKSHCLVFVPHSMNLKIEVGQGNINLKNMKQDFSIHLGKGIVSWKQKNRSDFHLKSHFAKNISGSDDGFSKNGKWTTEIIVDDGEIRYRE